MPSNKSDFIKMLNKRTANSIGAPLKKIESSPPKKFEFCWWSHRVLCDMEDDVSSGPEFDVRYFHNVHYHTMADCRVQRNKILRSKKNLVDEIIIRYGAKKFYHWTAERQELLNKLDIEIE